MDWDYPVYKAPAKKVSGRTVAQVKRTAMTREAALAFIAGDDPRPLLVLRECKVCNGTDEALLKGGVDNEKTKLLAAWFHCVKLPADVMEEDHPFHNLFQLEKPEHLFVSSVDGSNHDPLESQTSRSELWKSMRGLIATEYKSKADARLKTIAKLLDKMDVADARLADVKSRQEQVLEKDGPKSRKLAKLTKQLAAAQADRDELQGEATEALRMELKRKRETKAAPKD
jgi:hypothetical protein